MIASPAVAAVVHAFFEYAGIALGVELYRRARRQAGQGALTQPGSFAVMAGLLAGAAIAKALTKHTRSTGDAMVLPLAAGIALGRFDDRPGLAFKLFLSGYLAWRCFIDAFKPVLQPYALGLSGIQWVCALALLAYAPVVWRAWRTP